MPKLLRRREAGSDRLSVYAGWLDIANVAGPWEQSLQLTKFAALFYKWIVVPDGFFHCYGPLFEKLTEEVRTIGKKLPVKSSPGTPLLSLLRNGVLVPAIRKRDSLLDNWSQGREGVVPGEYLNVKRDDGAHVLQLVDNAAKYYIPWPDSLTPKNARRRSQFASRVQNLFLSEDSPYCITTADELLPKDLPHWMLTEDRLAAVGLLQRFEGTLREAKANPRFRRGDVEQVIADELKIPFHSYHDIVSKVDWEAPYQTLAASYAYYLLSVATSAYELMQATEFDCVAGLFPLHDNPVVEEEQIYRALVDITPGSEKALERPLVFGSLDVSALSIDKILDFREKDLFCRYCEFLSAIETPDAGQSFWDANPDFVDYVSARYLPAILKEFPSAGSVVYATSFAAALASAVTAYDADTLQFHGVPVLRILALATAALNIASRPWVPRIADYIIDKRRQRTFNRNNYALWRTNAPATGVGHTSEV